MLADQIEWLRLDRATRMELRVNTPRQHRVLIVGAGLSGLLKDTASTVKMTAEGKNRYG